MSGLHSQHNGRMAPDQATPLWGKSRQSLKKLGIYCISTFLTFPTLKNIEELEEMEGCCFSVRPKHKSPQVAGLEYVVPICLERRVEDLLKNCRLHSSSRVYCTAHSRIHKVKVAHLSFQPAAWLKAARLQINATWQNICCKVARYKCKHWGFLLHFSACACPLIVVRICNLVEYDIFISRVPRNK